jgi:predicted unusual protein kinase regulating ubiquinone biosynthesis (AarF/ABC1/UbiB family)
MSIESSRGRTPAYFAHATMNRPRHCRGCRTLLPEGASARIGVDRRRRRRIFCVACARDTLVDASNAEPMAHDDAESPASPAAMAACLPAIADAAGPPRGSLAVWLAVGALGIGALLASRTGRRFLATAGVAAKAASKSAVDRARGRSDTTPAIVRSAFEDLGPTYVKLGQLVASSEGLFPEPYCQEFRKCLDRVRPFPFADVERALRAELGREPDEIFESIDREPLASASIAQVHAARLRDGQHVVVKVQRPKIGEIVATDLRMLRWGARALTLFPHGELANPVGVVEDFEANILEELDFRREAANMAEFNRIMVAQRQSMVAAPRVIADFSTRRVLVMERFFGHRVDDVEKIKASKAQMEDRLLVGMRAWFQCMILHGFFHGDVHAGNLMALDDGRVGFLDFGIVGRFTRERREQVTDYLLAFATGDFDKLARVMVAMGSIERGRIDMGKLGQELAAAYEPLLSSTEHSAKYADIIPMIMRTGVKHGMRMPRDFVLVVKQMVYFDRYAKLLAPELNVFRDPRIVSGLMEDVMQAQAVWAGSPAPSAERAGLVLAHA